MAGNTIGKIFKVTTFGESHGDSLGCIIDGMPSGFELNINDIQIELDRRKPGTSKFVSPRKELDEVKILSGIFNGKTTGSSIGLLIKNKDKISSDYNNIKHVFRPGHADYTYFHKYGIRDYRGGGRSSARETCMRVAAGAIAKKFLKQKFNILIKAFLSQIYNIKCFFDNWNCVDNNDFFCPNFDQVKDIQYLLEKVKCNGNSIGSKITVYINNVPIGLGEPVFDKIDADLAHALMSINAVKAVEIGEGISSITQLGSDYHDKLIDNKFISNKCGGILGGISNGSPIITHIYIKPTPTLRKISGFNHYLNKCTNMKIIGRHDPCVGVRAIPISEAMTAIIIMDHILRSRAIKNI